MSPSTSQRRPREICSHRSSLIAHLRHPVMCYTVPVAASCCLFSTLTVTLSLPRPLHALLTQGGGVRCGQRAIRLSRSTDGSILACRCVRTWVATVITPWVCAVQTPRKFALTMQFVDIPCATPWCSWWQPSCVGRSAMGQPAPNLHSVSLCQQ
jgi:hypothetical protein